MDATNKSDHVDASTGDARGSNDAAQFTGLNTSTATAVAADVLNTTPVTNLQEGRQQVGPLAVGDVDQR